MPGGDRTRPNGRGLGFGRGRTFSNRGRGGGFAFRFRRRFSDYPFYVPPCRPERISREEELNLPYKQVAYMEDDVKVAKERIDELEKDERNDD